MTRTSRDDGFTLLELLTVIVIIGVLAAIAVPVFLAQKQRAFTSTMRSDLRNAVTAELAVNASTGSFTTVAADLHPEGYVTSGGVTPVHVKLVGETFVACVKHASVEEWLVYDGTEGSFASSPDDCV